MPYRKNAKRKYRKPGYFACGTMVVNDAARALAIAKSVRRLVNVEIKNFDIQQLSEDLTQTPVIVPLSNIAVGDTTNSRDGSQCKMVGIDLNYTITQATAGTSSFVRILLIQDKQTNQAIYTPADLLENDAAQQNIVSPRNLDNLKRFTVLYDRTIKLDGDGNRSHIVKKYIKKEVLLRYDASTSDIADLTQNSISLMQMTSAGSNLPFITSFNRLRFIDN